MNYMKMVNFTKISSGEAEAQIYFQEREDIFKNLFEKGAYIPYFVILEAIFQTAGRVAREHSNNLYGGSIVNYSDFNFKRPILLDELISIKAKLVSYQQSKRSFFLRVSVFHSDEAIIDAGNIIIKQEQNISPVYLNNN